MSADSQPIPAPSRPIPVSSPADYEPPPRFRWVAPLCIGVALGAVGGGGVTFTMMALATKPRGDLVARQFDANRALAATAGAENVRVFNDTTNEVGSPGRRGTTNAIRRRITLSGTVPPDANLGTLANQLKAAVDNELVRGGSWSAGGASTSSAGPADYTGSFESTYYTRDGHRGQLDLEVDVHGTVFRATLLLFEAK
jgi:hypothetical protein